MPGVFKAFEEVSVAENGNVLYHDDKAYFICSAKEQITLSQRWFFGRTLHIDDGRGGS